MYERDNGKKWEEGWKIWWERTAECPLGIPGNCSSPPTHKLKKIRVGRIIHPATLNESNIFSGVSCHCSPHSGYLATAKGWFKVKTEKYSSRLLPSETADVWKSKRGTYLWVKLLNILNQLKTWIPTDREKINEFSFWKASIFNMQTQRPTGCQLKQEKHTKVIEQAAPTKC